LALVAALACVKDRSPDRVPEGTGPLVAVYKMELSGAGAAARGAKISLWAEGPDRLHAEIMGSFGGVTFTLDAGGGRVCVVDVAQGIAYSGNDEAEVLEALVGLPVSTGDVVAAILHGAAPEGISVARDGGEAGALPARLRISDGRGSMTLSRVRVDRGRIDPARLGTGIPPEGLPERPLTELGSRR
jgi:hypothetical protein